MRYQTLGRSGLRVSDICLGTMIFGEARARSTPPEEAESIIHAYLDAGGNHIDTADVYAGGRSEEIVGRAIRGRRSQVVLATKVRFPTGDGPNEAGLSRQHIVAAVHASLRRLDTDYIDLLYMHCWDPRSPLAESLRAFDDLVAAGKVRYIGVSNFKAWQLMKALAVSDANGWVRFIAGQYQYSLVKRDIEYEYIDLCLEEGIGLVPWGPLGGGFLSGKYDPDRQPQSPEEGRLATTPDEEEESWDRRSKERNWEILAAVEEIAARHQASHSQVAIAWLRGKAAVASVVIGVRTMVQLGDNLGAARLELTAEEMAWLDAVSALPELYPYRFLESYCGGD